MAGDAVGRTMYRKIWDDHVVDERDDGTTLLAVDRELIYEAGSAQVFRRLERRGVSVRQPQRAVAVPDHAVPTHDRSETALAGTTKDLLDTLARNCAAHGIEHIAIDDPRQGIVHIIGPEQGLTLPGMVICCADSHTVDARRLRRNCFWGWRVRARTGAGYAGAGSAPVTHDAYHGYR